MINWYLNGKTEVTVTIVESDIPNLTKYDWTNMRSKKYMSKCGCCIILYFCFCFGLIFMKVYFTSNTLLKFNVKEGKGNTNLHFVSTFKSSRVCNHTLVKSEHKKDITEASIDFQAIEISIQRIANVCEKYNKTSSLERTHFLYSPEHDILYCWIRKVASTSFTKLFADLRGFRVTGNYYKRINLLAPKSINELLNVIDDPDVFKFLVVRHPFERLVSFYRSRIEDNSKYSDQSWLFTQKIFYLTRPKLFHFNDSTGNVLQQIFYNDRRLKLIPTFKEFIIWLLKEPEELDDPHWRQYYSHCSVCQMRADYVLKLDNYSIADINYVLSLMNTNRKQWELPRLGRTNKEKTNFERTCSYLSELSADILYKLFERYKIDFEMFDYDYGTYKSCVK